MAPVRTSPLQIPNGYTEVITAYGDPQFDGHTVSPKWESANMIVIRNIPCGIGKLYVHKNIAAPLMNALGACERLQDGYIIERIGCFAPRFQRGSTSAVSLHTFGIAVDINPERNMLVFPCELNDPRRTDPRYSNIPRAWIDAFEAEGWFWGGRFKHRFDPMHLQFATGV